MVTSLFISALSVSGPIFMVLELYSPHARSNLDCVPSFVVVISALEAQLAWRATPVTVRICSSAYSRTVSSETAISDSVHFLPQRKQSEAVRRSLGFVLFAAITDKENKYVSAMHMRTHVPSGPAAKYCRNGSVSRFQRSRWGARRTGLPIASRVSVAGHDRSATESHIPVRPGCQAEQCSAARWWFRQQR